MLKKSKVAVRFKKVRWLARFVRSNQRGSEKSFVSGLELRGHSQTKLAFDVPVMKKSRAKEVPKHADIVAAFDALDEKKIGLARLLKSEHLAQLRESEHAVLHALFAYISSMPSTLELPLIRRIFANVCMYVCILIREERSSPLWKFNSSTP